jgi:hypothetical protein
MVSSPRSTPTAARPSDSTRTVAAGASAASVLHDPLRDPADAAARLQPAVSLICRARRRRAGVGADAIYEEPRTAIGGGGCAQVSGRAFEPQAGARAAIGRALLG